jgi:hypothetical protein
MVKNGTNGSPFGSSRSAQHSRSGTRAASARARAPSSLPRTSQPCRPASLRSASLCWSQHTARARVPRRSASSSASSSARARAAGPSLLRAASGRLASQTAAARDPLPNCTGTSEHPASAPSPSRTCTSENPASAQLRWRSASSVARARQERLCCRAQGGTAACRSTAPCELHLCALELVLHSHRDIGQRSLSFFAAARLASASGESFSAALPRPKAVRPRPLRALELVLHSCRDVQHRSLACICAGARLASSA